MTGQRKAIEFILSLDFPGALVAAAVALERRRQLGLGLTRAMEQFAAMPINVALWTPTEMDVLRPVINELAAEMTGTRGDGK